MSFKKAGIILKKDSSYAEKLGNELVHWLVSKGIETTVDNISSDLDILIILGGDGTLLHVAEQASCYQVPVVGVNLGNLGFLTEVAQSERFEALDSILLGSAVIEERIMLKARIVSDNKSYDWRYALNDVVISKGTIDRLVRLCTWVGKEYLATYKADGLIFSTPTGSTAYNLSAGGPIVHPGLDSLMVTPICPFMLESRPVLLPSSVRLSTKLANQVADVKVIVDGQPAWDMTENDSLEVVAAENPLKLICSSKQGYFDILRKKLNWGGAV